MNTLQIILRLLHIGFGVFWAGTIFFFAFLLEPSLRTLGPDGGKVMQALQKRHFLTIMPAAALVTILSGLALFWYSSGGFAPDWMGSSFGTTLSIGSLAALIAFGLGMIILRPTAMKIGKLGATLASVTEPDRRDAILAELDGLKSRTGKIGRVIAFTLIIAVVAMAIARYV